MSAYYDDHPNATRPYVIIVSAHVSTPGSTAITAITEVVRSSIRAVDSFDHRFFDDDCFPSAPYYLPPRPRKGAYVVLLPRLPFVPSLEASPKSAPRVVRQAGWRLAVHTRHVTTSL